MPRFTTIGGFVSDDKHPPNLPLRGNPLSPLFPSPILIPPLMGKSVFPPRSPPLTGKRDVSLISPSPDEGEIRGGGSPLISPSPDGETTPAESREVPCSSAF